MPTVITGKTNTKKERNKKRKEERRERAKERTVLDRCVSWEG